MDGRDIVPLVPNNRGFMSPQAMEQAVALKKIKNCRKFVRASLLIIDANGSRLILAGARELPAIRRTRSAECGERIPNKANNCTKSEPQG